MKLCVALCVFTTVLDACSGACYFSPEMQGEYVMQSTTSQGQYSKVKVMDDNIPIWGQCHHRIGNNVILTDRYNIEEDCIRCFHLKLLSRNILQVRTEGLDKCYTNEKAAEASCDNQDGFKTIILYKTKELAGEEITKAYCPINGRFSFVYNVNDGSENNVECSRPLSELDDCPKRSSSALNLRFRGCSFDNHDIKFECLGDWEGPDNQHYLALLDTRQQGEQRPQYRCALYKEDEHTGNIFMAFSSDSTCTTNLHSATSGFETLNLTAVDKTEWPPEVSSSNCRFQPWAQGKWEHMIVNENTVLYKDHSTYKTLTVRCVNEDSFNAERMIVYIQSTCGEEMYTCIWVKQRSKNVLEFQIGTKSSTSYDNSLCMDFNFQNKVWLTQGRLDRSQESPCPIRGEYTGFIPDTTEACAKLASDTKFPEIMYYTVSDCKQQEIYEEREYRCLGQWEEEGLTYTYTQRKDIGTYECFVGSIISNNEIYIKEAGKHCERDIDPLKYGMKLLRKGTQEGMTMAPGSQRPIDRFTGRFPSSTKPWNPVAGTQEGMTGSPDSQRPMDRFTTSRSPPTKPWKPITAPPSQSIACTAKLTVVTVIITLYSLFMLC